MFAGCRVTGRLGSLSLRMRLICSNVGCRGVRIRRWVGILDVSIVTFADDQEE